MHIRRDDTALHAACTHIEDCNHVWAPYQTDGIFDRLKSAPKDDGEAAKPGLLARLRSATKSKPKVQWDVNSTYSNLTRTYEAARLFANGDERGPRYGILFGMGEDVSKYIRDFDSIFEDDHSCTAILCDVCIYPIQNKLVMKTGKSIPTNFGEWIRTSLNTAQIQQVQWIRNPSEYFSSRFNNLQQPILAAQVSDKDQQSILAHRVSDKDHQAMPTLAPPVSDKDHRPILAPQVSSRDPHTTQNHDAADTEAPSPATKPTHPYIVQHHYYNHPPDRPWTAPPVLAPPVLAPPAAAPPIRKKLTPVAAKRVKQTTPVTGKRVNNNTAPVASKRVNKTKGAVAAVPVPEKPAPVAAVPVPEKPAPVAAVPVPEKPAPVAAEPVPGIPEKRAPVADEKETKKKGVKLTANKV